MVCEGFVDTEEVELAVQEGEAGDCLAEQRSWSNLECCLHFINTDRFRPDAGARRAVRAEQGVENRFVALAVANLINDPGLRPFLTARHWSSLRKLCPPRIGVSEWLRKQLADKFDRPVRRG